MGDQPLKAFGGDVDLRAVAGVKHAPGFCLQACAGGHEIGEIAIRRRNEGRGPTHHVICGKAGIAPCKRDMIANMTGGVDDAQAPAVASNHLAIGHCSVGREIQINPFSAAGHTCRCQRLHHSGTACVSIAEGENGGACARL